MSPAEKERIKAIEDSARNLVDMWDDPIKVAEHLLDLVRRQRAEQGEAS